VFPDDYSRAELDAIAARALAEGADYSRALLRGKLATEEVVDAVEAALDQVRGVRRIVDRRLECG